MYTKLFLVASAVLFATQSSAEAQLFRRYSKASQNGNCCQTQSQTQSQTQVQTQVQTWQPAPQYVPAESYYPAPTNNFQLVDSPSVVGSFSYESLPGEIVVSQPQYGGIPANSPYTSPVVGSSSPTSGLLNPLVVATDANAGIPTTGMGPSVVAPTAPMAAPTFEAPPEIPMTTENQAQVIQPNTAGTEPTIPANVSPTIVGGQSEPGGIIETHTVAPVTPDEPAPAAIPGQMEMEFDSRESVLETKTE